MLSYSTQRCESKYILKIYFQFQEIKSKSKTWRYGERQIYQDELNYIILAQPGMFDDQG